MIQSTPARAATLTTAAPTARPLSNPLTAATGRGRNPSHRRGDRCRRSGGCRRAGHRRGGGGRNRHRSRSARRSPGGSGGRRRHRRQFDGRGSGFGKADANRFLLRLHLGGFGFGRKTANGGYVWCILSHISKLCGGNLGPRLHPVKPLNAQKRAMFSAPQPSPPGGAKSPRTGLPSGLPLNTRTRPPRLLPGPTSI